MGKNLEKLYSFRCDEKTITKINYIAKEEDRTRNDQIKHLIKKCIRDYEKEHGEIKIENI